MSANVFRGTLFVVVLLIAGVAALSFRYETIRTEHALARVDRWTGRVEQWSTATGEWVPIARQVEQRPARRIVPDEPDDARVRAMEKFVAAGEITPKQAADQLYDTTRNALAKVRWHEAAARLSEIAVRAGVMTSHEAAVALYDSGSVRYRLMVLITDTTRSPKL